MPLEVVLSRSYFGRTSADLMVRRSRSSPWHLWLRLFIECALGDGAESVVLCSHLGRPNDEKIGSSTWHQWLRLSVKCALEDGAKSVVLCSHLGRPSGEEIEKFSMAPVAEVVHQVCTSCNERGNEGAGN